MSCMQLMFFKIRPKTIKSLFALMDGRKIRRDGRSIFFFFFFKSEYRRNAIPFMCVHSWACKTSELKLTLVLKGGCIPLYLVKEPFWNSYKQVLSFNLNIFVKKCKNWVSRKEKKKPTLIFHYLGQSEKGKQTFFFKGLIKKRAIDGRTNRKVIISPPETENIYGQTKVQHFLLLTHQNMQKVIQPCPQSGICRSLSQQVSQAWCRCCKWVAIERVMEVRDTKGRFMLPWNKSIFFLKCYAPCVLYSIDFLCIICHNDHFRQRKCILSWPDKVPEKKKIGVMDFYASRLCSTSKNLLENIHSWMLDVQDIWWPWNEYEQGLNVENIVFLSHRVTTKLQSCIELPQFHGDSIIDLMHSNSLASWSYYKKLHAYITTTTLC